MQAASCSREGEYCRLIRVSVIIVGYVRFRLKPVFFRKSVQAIKTKGLHRGCVSRNLSRSWIAVCSFHAIF